MKTAGSERVGLVPPMQSNIYKREKANPASEWAGRRQFVKKWRKKQIRIDTSTNTFDIHLY
jgi:hypothetical protein